MELNSILMIAKSEINSIWYQSELFKLNPIQFSIDEYRIWLNLKFNSILNDNSSNWDQYWIKQRYNFKKIVKFIDWNWMQCSMIDWLMVHRSIRFQYMRNFFFLVIFFAAYLIIITMSNNGFVCRWLCVCVCVCNFSPLRLVA